MDNSITAQCCLERESRLILDMVGNRLPVGSVIMCILTPFVIMEDSDIVYMGGGKMEMVFWTDDEYLSSWINRSRNFTWKGVRDS